MKSLYLVLFLALGAGTVIPKANAQDTLSLRSLILSSESHPSIQSKLAMLHASSAALAQSGAWPEPELMLGVESLPTNSFRFDQDMMTEKMIGISQRIPFPGKLAGDEEVAAQDTIVSRWEIAETVAGLARDVKVGYFTLFANQEALRVDEHHEKVMTQLQDFATELVTTGKLGQADALAAALALEWATAAVLDDTREIAKARAQLAEVSNQEIPAGTTVQSVGLPSFTYSLAALDSIAAASRPMVQQLKANAVAMSMTARRASLDRYPDFMVSLSYMQRNDLAADAMANPTNSMLAQSMGMSAVPMAQPDMISAGISIMLPTNTGKYHAAIEEAQARETSAESSIAAALHAIHATIETDLAQLDVIRKQYALIEDRILPLLKQSAETQQANLALGKASVQDVLRITMQLAEEQRKLAALEASYNEAIADIEFAVGRTLVTRY